MRLHAFAALVLGNFCLPSFLKRAHSDLHIRKARFNHRSRRVATSIGGDIALQSVRFFVFHLS
jgi:hypothetical protein